jgi:hypothetical protein
MRASGEVRCHLLSRGGAQVIEEESNDELDHPFAAARPTIRDNLSEFGDIEHLGPRGGIARGRRI